MKIRLKIIRLTKKQNQNNTGTTASLKIVGEGFPWSNQSTLSYYQGSHNSLVGVREYATRSGSQVRTFDLSHLEQSLFSSSFSSSSPSPSSSSSSPSPSSPSSPSSFDHQAINIHHFGKQVPPTKKGDSQIEKEEEEKKEEKKTELQNGGGGGKRKRHYSLVALPAQCNFSGTILPFEKFHKKMERSNSVGDHRTLFLLDAAAFLPHHPFFFSFSFFFFFFFSFFFLFFFLFFFFFLSFFFLFSFFFFFLFFLFFFLFFFFFFFLFSFFFSFFFFLFLFSFFFPLFFFVFPPFFLCFSPFFPLFFFFFFFLFYKV